MIPSLRLETLPLGLLVLLSLSAHVSGQSGTSSADAPEITALVDCHLHDNVQYCIPKPSGDEVVVTTATSPSQSLPTAYTDCHLHGDDFFCVDDKGKDVAIESLSHTDHNHDEEEDHAGHDHEGEEDEHEHTQAESASSGRKCHFHAGVEHCTGGDADESKSTCSRMARDYNVPLRVGSVFIVLATSAFCVLFPIIFRRFTPATPLSRLVFIAIKQFGTGVIVSTAFVHLITHAGLMFSNPCVGELAYESTTTAIVMAGIFIAFIIEFAAERFLGAKVGCKQLPHIHNHKPDEVNGSDSSVPSSQELSSEEVNCEVEGHLPVFVMETGIIFHSAIIGLTLVVAGDSVFKSLLVVIIFHQGFEGLALGTRISSLAPTNRITTTKMLLAAAFTFITPIGMAIGIGVRHSFNGQDRATLIVMGTLDAFSAGILVWVGVVEMWATDWLHGQLRHAGIGTVGVALTSLIAGFVIMSLLGKWA